MEIEEVKAIEVIAPIRDRWSPRSFSAQPVEDALIASLFEAARWAPSAHNEQPWRYIIATKEDPEAYQKALSSLTEGNQRWASTAPVIILTFAKTTFDHTGRMNPHSWHDLALSEANIMAQATAHGLYLHPMAGIRRDHIREVYQVPDDYEPVTGLALGYPGSPDALPEDLRIKELRTRVRRPLSEFVFSDSWDHAASLTRKPENHPNN